MFCPNCGAENKDNSAPCVRCGFKLSGVSASKFKGTIMLNSDETVQELIEAQRRKLQGSTPPPAPDAGAPTPPEPAAPTGTETSGGVPRPRRKLGGATILGVAPQMGGFRGAPEAGTLESPEHPGRVPTPAPQPVRAPSTPPADPHAPTEAMAAFSASGGNQGETPAPARGEAAPAHGTQPLQQSTALPSNTSFEPQTAAMASLGGGAPNKTVPLQQVSEPALDPANTTAPLPPQAPAADPARASSLPPTKKGLSLGELFLVVATCGVYGVVRMLRRKAP